MNAPPTTDEPTHGTWVAVVLAVGLLLAVVIYGPAATSAEYVHDDHPAVLDNPLVTWPPDLAAIWRAPWFGTARGFRTQGLSRPLVTLGYAAEAGLGLSSMGRHAVNLALFGLVCGLVGLLVGALWRRDDTEGAPLDVEARAAALLATLLFALHPVHTSSVMAVAYRPELQATALALLATLALVAVARGRRRWAPVAVALLLLAVWSKESALTVTVAWGLWALTRPRAGGRSRRLTLATAGAALAVSAAWLAWRHTWLGAPWVSAHDNPLGAVSTGPRVVGALWLMGHAARKLALPTNLAPDETFDALPVTDPDGLGVLVGGALLVGLTALAARGLRRGRQGTPRAGLSAAAIAWFGGAWLPVSHLLFPATVLFADRLLFLPSVAAVGVAAVALARPLASPSGRAFQRPVAVAVLLALAVPWAAMAHGESMHWTDELTLFRHGANQRPRSLRMRFNYGLRLLETGDPATAMTHLEAALALDPDDRATWTLAVQAATRLKDCGRSAQLLRAPPRKPDDASRMAQVDADMGCGRFGAAFRAGAALQRPDAAFAKKVYVAGVAAGKPQDARRWARRFVADPATSPAWVAAAVYAEQRARRPAAALARLRALHQAKPALRAVVAQAQQLCRSPKGAQLTAACAAWPGERGPAQAPPAPLPAALTAAASPHRALP